MRVPQFLRVRWSHRGLTIYFFTTCLKKEMAFISIETKFLSQTNHRGYRIKATSMQTFSGGRKPSITIPYDSDSTSEENHRDAAERLLPEVVNDPRFIKLVAGACDRGYIFTPVFDVNPLGLSIRS
jgi:hypothetical protein